MTPLSSDSGSGRTPTQDAQQAFIESLPDDLYRDLTEWVHAHVLTFCDLNATPLPEGWDPTHEFGEEVVCHTIAGLWPYFTASHRHNGLGHVLTDPIVDTPKGPMPLSEALDYRAYDAHGDEG